MIWFKWIVLFTVVVAPQFISAQIIINEIHADPAPGLAGDANGDGIRSSDDDEFVELVNNSSSDIDISGWTLSDAVGVKHTFPAGSIMAANCAIVIFGGGSPTGSFGNARVQTTSTLSLNNSGDTVTLNDGAVDVAGYTYGSEGGNDQSITRDPDISGTTLVKHSTVTGSGGRLFSPGTQIDNSAFSGCAGNGSGTGKLTIFKVTNPGGGTGFSFAGDLGTFTLDDGQNQVFDELQAGDYDITESLQMGWFLNSIDVNGGNNTAITNGITIHLQANEDIAVTFNNVQSVPEADLALTKTDATDPVTIGDNIVYTLAVTNNGPDQAINVVATDTLPASVTFVSANPEQGSSSHSGGVVITNLGNVANDNTVKVTIVVTADNSGTLNNVASVSSDTEDPAAGNNFAAEITTVQPLPNTSVLINELDSDTPGADDREFIELFDGGAGNTSLDGKVLVLFNGSTDQSYAAYDLDGFITDANGFLVIGSSNVTNVDLIISNNSIQNGADAVALYFGNGSGFPNGTPVTTSKLIDALVYDTSDPDDPGLLALLNSGQPQVNEAGAGDKDNHSIQRIANGSGGARNTGSYVPIPPTPGETNAVLPEADLAISKQDDVDPAFAGENIIYTISVTNNGPDLAENVVATDTLPAGVTFVSATPDQGAASQSNGLVIVTFGDVANKVTAKVDIMVTANAAGSLTNKAGVLSATADPDFNNNSVSEQTEVRPQLSTTVIINEIDSDTPGSDDMEFVELFDGGRGNTSLDGLVLALFNGTSDQSYAAFDLDGHKTDASGFFVIGNTGVPNVDKIIANATLQNGADAVALYFGQDSNFPNNTPVTTSRLVDAVVYGADDADDAGLLVLLQNGQPQLNENQGNNKDNHSLQRIANGSGGARKTSSYLAIPPTPGVRNMEPPKEPDISVAKTEIDFGNVLAGEEFDIDLFINNKGEANLLVDSTGIVGPGAGEWLITTGAAPFTVNLRGDQKVRLCFNPQSGGPKIATLRIRSNDPDEDPLLIELRGRGLAPVISASTRRLLFGRVNVGDSKQLSFDLHNAGSADLNITDIILRGSNGSQFSFLNAKRPLTLLPGESELQTINFTPDSVGALKAHLRFFSNDPLNPEFSVPMTGVGRANQDTSASDSSLAGLIVINEIHYNPGTNQGSDSNFEFIELFNRHNETVLLAGHAFVEGISHAFQPGDTISPGGFLVLAIDSSSYLRSLEWESGNLVNSGEPVKLVNASGAVVDSVAYASSTPWPGEANGKGASLELIAPELDNNLAGSWQASLVPGGTPGAINSTEGSVEPDIAVSPISLDFGDVEPGASANAGVEIQNVGSAELKVAQAHISGPDSNSWAIDNGSHPFNLLPGEIKMLQLDFAPTDTGAKSARLVLLSNDPDEGTFTVQLRGNGLVIVKSPLAGIVIINEIHYNPATSQGSDSDYEFLELVNTSIQALPLEGLSFSQGISHIFVVGDTLPANGYLVLAQSQNSYSGSVEWSSGNLKNTGEVIKLLDADGRLVDFIEYKPGAPWPKAADGQGPSLELIDPATDNSIAENWQPSAVNGGTPGLQNSNGSQVAELVVIPAAHDFGVINRGDEQSVEIQILNQGQEILEIKEVKLTGSGKNNFKLSSITLPATLAQNQFIKAVVSTQPESLETRTALLSIISNDPVQTNLQAHIQMYVNTPPQTPELLQPDWGATAETFLWRQIEDPDPEQTCRFTLEVAMDEYFQIERQSLGALSDTSITMQEVAAALTLNNSLYYYWRVKSVDNYQAQSEYSATGFFKYLDMATHVGITNEKIPTQFTLDQNYPNPFNPETRIGFQLPKQALVTIHIFNTRGKLIRKYPGKTYLAGSHSIVWRGKNATGRSVASGIYLVTMRAIDKSVNAGSKFVMARKMTLLR